MKIETRRVADLVPADYNPRTISPEALAGLQASIRRWGIVEPIIVNERTGRIVGGHQRLKALAADGEPETPVVVVDLPEVEEKALNVALNSQSIAGEFTPDLGAILDEVEAELPDLYEAVRLDALRIEQGLGGGDDPPGEDPLGDLEPPEEPDSRQGEVYQLGPHRVVCGDCRVPETWDVLLDGLGPVNVAFTSPPYAQQRKYDEASGFKPIPPDEYVDWFDAVQEHVRAHLADDGSWFVNIKAHCEAGQRSLYVMDLVLAHVRQWGWRFVDELCWERNTVPGKFVDRFKNGWEPVYHFAVRGGVRFRPQAVAHASEYAIDYDPTRDFGNTSAGYTEVDGKAKSAAQYNGRALPPNIIRCSQDHAFGTKGANHAAPFPVALPTFFVKAYSDPGDIIADPFMGSGSTLMAAAQEGRAAVGHELSPAYCDVIRRRWTAWAEKAGQDPGPAALA